MLMMLSILLGLAVFTVGLSSLVVLQAAIPCYTVGKGSVHYATVQNSLLLIVGALIVQHNPEVATGIFAAGLGVPSIPINKEKETTMNDQVNRLINLIFGRDPQAIVDYVCEDTVDEMKTIPIAVRELSFSTKGKITDKPLEVSVPATGPDVKVPLVLDKHCVASVGNLPLQGLRYYHVQIPKAKDDVKSVAKREQALLGIRLFLKNNALVPFGSIKVDKKGRSKFYALPLNMASKYANNVGEFLPYFHKVFTDCKEVGIYRVKVVEPATFDAEGVAKHNELFSLGVDDHNDGCGLVRPSIGCTQFQGVPTANIGGKLPIAKGFLDSCLFDSDADWDDEFGDVDIVLFKKDQIKTFSDIADDGLWVVGFTWMNGREIPHPFHWELTQFLHWNDEVKDVLKSSIDKAIKALFDQVSTKEGLREYISAKIKANIEAGYDVKIQMKVIAMLYSKATHNFKWVKQQVASMILGDVWKITKNNGVVGHGIPLLTSDELAKVDPRYTPYDVTRATGGDNDGDYIVYIVNKSLRKMLYWRFPVVAGPVLRDIPSSLMDSVEDLHPEIVELFVKYGYSLSFSRDDIQKERNVDSLDTAYKVAIEIIKGEGIGNNTMILKRMLSAYGESLNDVLLELSDEQCLELAFSATQGIEMGAIALKYKVKGDAVKSAFPPKGTSRLFPLVFAKVGKPMTWDSIVPILERLQTVPEERAKYSLDIEPDSELYVYALTQALDSHKTFMEDVVTPSEMKEYVELTGIPSIHDIREAVRMLKKYGQAMRTAYEKYAPSTGDSDATTIAKEKELYAALNLIVKALENYGKTISIEALCFSCFKFLGDTSGTGSAAIHMAGNRIFKVFGKDPNAGNAYVDLPEHKEEAVWVEGWRRGGDIPKDLDPTTGKIHGNTARFPGGIRLELHGNVPTTNGVIVAIDPGRTQSGKRSAQKCTMIVKVSA